MIIQHSKFNLVEQSTPMLMMGLAIWFLWAELPNVSTTYYFLQILPDWLWSVVFAAISLTKTISILCGWYMLRRVAALISVVLWYSLVVIFGLGNYHSLLIPICAFFGFQSALSFLRIYEDRRKGNGELWNTRLMIYMRRHAQKTIIFLHYYTQKAKRFYHAQKTKWNGKT